MPALADLLAEVRQEIARPGIKIENDTWQYAIDEPLRVLLAQRKLGAGARAADRAAGIELTPVGAGRASDAGLARRHLAQDRARRGARALRVRGRECRRAGRLHSDSAARPDLDVQPHRGVRRSARGRRRPAAIVASLSAVKGEAPMEGAPFFALSGREAARHLFRVAAGSSRWSSSSRNSGPGSCGLHRRRGCTRLWPSGSSTRRSALGEMRGADPHRPLRRVRQLDGRWACTLDAR